MNFRKLIDKLDESAIVPTYDKNLKKFKSEIVANDYEDAEYKIADYVSGYVLEAFMDMADVFGAIAKKSKTSEEKVKVDIAKRVYKIISEI